MTTGFCQLFGIRRMTKGFGQWQPERMAFHNGIDLECSWSAWGDEVVSATNGVVVEAGYHGNRGGFGYRVRVQTVTLEGQGVLIRYGHLAGGEGIYVSIGDRVVVGQKLGRPGPEGHLHFDVMVGNNPADPVLLVEWPGGNVPPSLSPPPAFSRQKWSHAVPQAARLPRRDGGGKAVISGGGGGHAPADEPDGSLLVLLPPIRDSVARINWRTAAAIGASARMGAVAHPADDAHFEPDGWDIVVVNPAQWTTDPQRWLSEHGLDTGYRIVEPSTPWDMAIQLLPLLKGDIGLAQIDPRWADYDFGEHPDVGDETIGRYGCFLTGFAIILRKVYGRDVTPPLLDKLLVAARAAYVNDNIMAWEGAVPLFSVFDDHIKDNQMRSARALDRLLRDGWEVILRRADGGHFVYLEAVDGETLHIIDTWDGRRKDKSAAEYAGVRAAHVRARGYAPPPSRVLVGLHDRSGGEWMAAHGMTGCCLVHHAVQHQPIQIDCTPIQQAGITVICRLNWGYADGSGTLPRPEDRDSFISSVVETMLGARGVDYFHVGNEPNTRSEWPGVGSDHEFPLTPGYVTAIYNEIWQRVAGRVRMGPPPIDPYFGPGSNNRDWWLTILHDIAGADALFLHAKTQTNEPSEVWSRERFTHEPLTWQYLHLRTVETSLDMVPGRFRSLPVFVTELNPQCLRTIGGTIGWLPDNSAWVHEALRYFREEQPVTGVVFYRYDLAGDQAPFGLANKPDILNAILQESRMG